MEQSNKKQKLIEVGADLFHLNGYTKTGINEVLESAEIPKGSFYFYFKNKESFGMDVLEYYNSHFIMVAKKHLKDRDNNYLKGLYGFFEDFHNYFEQKKFTGGCPTGNFAQELGDINEKFRLKLKENFFEMRNTIMKFLELAKDNNELRKNIDIKDTADFIINCWEGALIRMKIEKNRKPLDLFTENLLNNFLTGKE